MLKIVIPAIEKYDEINNEFINYKEQVLCLEHSLVSISKWESKWHKAFLTSKEKTTEETIDYVRCMTLTQNVNPDVYTNLTRQNMEDVSAYIGNPMSATWFAENESKGKSRDVITSELIYYWMIALNIPFECQKWHLNRLLTLIRVCNIKNQPEKKMSKNQLYKRNKALNDARRKQMNTRG